MDWNQEEIDLIDASFLTTAPNVLNFIKKQNIPTHDSDAVVTSLYNKPSKEFISYLKSTGLSKAVKQKKIDKDLVKNEVLNNRRKLKKSSKNNKAQNNLISS